MNGDRVVDNVNVLRVGFLAPDFSLTDTLGRTFSLIKSLADNFWAICFFPARAEARVKGYLKELSSGLPASLSGLPVRIVGISPDRPNFLARLGEQLKLDFPLLSDPRLTVAARYYVIDSGSHQPSVYFSIFIVDDNGIIRHRVSEIPGVSAFSMEVLRSEISRLV